MSIIVDHRLRHRLVHPHSLRVHREEHVFAYTFLWASVHPIPGKSLSSSQSSAQHFSLFPSRHEERLTPFVRQLLQSFPMPSDTFKLTDFYPNISASPRFIPVQSWLRAHEVTYDCIAKFQGPLRLLSMIISPNHPVGLDSAESGFGKIISILKLKDLSKMPEAEGVFDKLIRSTYFTKHIVPLHNAYTNSKDPPTNRSQESNGDQMTGALRSCQSHPLSDAMLK
jgi:hypothetical protein